MSENELTTEQQNWKVKFLITGTALGAVVGLATAYLMARNAEEMAGGPPKITTNDALKAGLNVIGLIRGLAALGGG